MEQTAFQGQLGYSPISCSPASLPRGLKVFSGDFMLTLRLVMGTPLIY